MPSEHYDNPCQNCGSLGPHVRCSTCSGPTCHCELVSSERGPLCPWCATVVTNWKLLAPLVREAIKSASVVKAL